MEPFGKLIFLYENESSEIQWDLISSEIFSKYNTIPTPVSIDNILQLKQFVQDGINFKRYHAMENYARLISIISSKYQSLIKMDHLTTIQQRKIVFSEEIIPKVVIFRCLPNFLENRALKIVIEGENLFSILLSSLEIIDSPQHNSDKRKIYSKEILQISKNQIEIYFYFPPDYIINSSKALISLTNYFTIFQTTTLLPFQTVWLVGKTGAGKSQLRKAFETLYLPPSSQTPNPSPNPSDNPNGKKSKSLFNFGKSKSQILTDSTVRNDSSLVPRVHVVPEEHKEYERSLEYNRIHFYEFNGFTEFNDTDLQTFLSSLQDNPPCLILLVVNIAETVRLPFFRLFFDIFLPIFQFFNCKYFNF